MEITLTRVEGPSEDCNKPVSYENFADADKLLSRWSRTAPEHGGYHKVDFTIKDEEQGISYAGRYDLKHWKLECAHLRGHIIEHLEFVTGARRPMRMSQEQYQQHVDKFYPQDYRDAAVEMLAFFRTAP